MSRVKLEDVAQEHKEVFKGDKTDLPVVGLEHLIPKQIKLENWDVNTDNTFSKYFRKGNVLFGRRRAYLKKAALATVDGICSGDITVIEAKPGKIYPLLLPFIIQNDGLFDYAVGKSAGSLSPRVKWEHLKNYQFNLPDDLNKQKELADLLWSMYETKRSYQEMIKSVDKLVLCEFNELLKDSLCKKLLIKDVFTLQMGKTPSRDDPKCWESRDYKWISISDMEEDAHYTSDTKEYISDYAVKTSGIKKVPKNTVIMSFKLTIGRTAITSEDVYTNEAIMAFIPKTEINADYVRYFLSHKDWSERSNQAVKGITLNKDSIGNSTIIIPSEKVLKKIVLLLETSEETKANLLKSISDLEGSINKILQKNFNAEEEDNG